MERAAHDLSAHADLGAVPLIGHDADAPRHDRAIEVVPHLGVVVEVGIKDL